MNGKKLRERVNFTILPDTKERLRLLSKQQDRTMSNYVERMILMQPLSNRDVLEQSRLKIKT